MRALVTGGAGFIGSALVRALQTRGDDVVAFDSLITSDTSRLPSDVELIKDDLRDLEAVRRACRDVDVVFHQGALRSVPMSVDDPVLATECNLIGTLHVLVGAQEAGVERVVYASSSSAYGDESREIQREDDRPAPASPYAASKLGGENYCRVWTKLHGLPTISLRYFNVFGPGQDPDSKYAAVFPTFVKALLAGEAPVVHWDGEQSRDFTYIDDVVRANLLAAAVDRDKLLEAGGAVVNIGGGRPKSINDALRSVADALGTWIEPERVPRRTGDIRSSRADITRASELLGWKPEVPWDDAVAQTVEHLRSVLAG